MGYIYSSWNVVRPSLSTININDKLLSYQGKNNNQEIRGQFWYCNLSFMEVQGLFMTVLNDDGCHSKLIVFFQ